MSSHQSPMIYGLLYVDEQQRSHTNIRGGGDSLDIYLRCAVLCAKSVASHGYRFRLVTNAKRRIEQRVQDLNLGPLDVLEQEFSLNVPDDLPFWAAHFKLDLYRALGTGQLGEHVGIIDIDAVMLSPIDFPPLPPGIILTYDITDQIVKEFGDERIRADLERVAGRGLSECKWYGGEFIFGHAESFRKLANAIFQIWPNYVACTSQLHHVGDEVLVAAALPMTNLKVLDAGKLGFVARWWTARTHFKQMTFDAVSATRNVLHLPSDKIFLAAFAAVPYSPAEFLKQYRRAARGKLIRRRLFNLSEMLLGRKRKYVANLS